MDRIKIGTFGELRSPMMTIHPTIAEHVHANADPHDVADLGKDAVLPAYRKELAGALIQYGIVLDGEELYLDEYGFEPHRAAAARAGRTPLEEVLVLAAQMVGFVDVQGVVDRLYRETARNA